MEEGGEGFYWRRKSETEGENGSHGRSKFFNKSAESKRECDGKEKETAI